MLAFDVHIDYSLKRLKSRLGFVFLQIMFFPLENKIKIIQSTFFTHFRLGDSI